jgi:plasmid stability protein
MPGVRAKGVSVRNIGVPDALWHAAKEKASDEGRSLSAVIREFLTQYVTSPPHQV